MSAGTLHRSGRFAAAALALAVLVMAGGRSAAQPYVAVGRYDMFKELAAAKSFADPPVTEVKYTKA